MVEILLPFLSMLVQPFPQVGECGVQGGVSMGSLVNVRNETVRGYEEAK